MDENCSEKQTDQTLLEEEPERFDPALLQSTAAVRLAWFEKECTIEHAFLLQESSQA